MIKQKERCKNYHEDGCGHYCKAINIQQLKDVGRIIEDYPHKYWRVMCCNNQTMCPFGALYTEEEGR